MNDYSTEVHRIRSVYAKRDASSKPGLYTWHREEVLFNTYRFRAVAARLLAGNGFSDLSSVQALDVGCGTGAWLRVLMEWGASPENLHGIDLLADRIARAKSLVPLTDFRLASGYEIPYGDGRLDLVSAHTVFSSILDPSARKALAQEMSRVLKSAGCVIIYDYRISDPRNLDTIGIRKTEILRLFPGFKLRTISLTLAPPLARTMAPLSSLLTHALETLFPFFRTHIFYFLWR